MDYRQDPYYQWLRVKEKELKLELERTNRREGRKLEHLRATLRDLKARKIEVMQEDPKFTDYGVF